MNILAIGCNLRPVVENFNFFFFFFWLCWVFVEGCRLFIVVYGLFSSCGAWGLL